MVYNFLFIKILLGRGLCITKAFSRPLHHTKYVRSISGGVFEFPIYSKLSNVTGYTYVGQFWVKFYDPNSVINPADKIDVEIYPNPVVDYLIIEYNRDMQWELISITGQLLMTGADERIDVSSLNTGYYILKIMTAEGFITKKVLKQ